MADEKEPADIYEAILAIMREVKPVQKDISITGNVASYKAVSHGAVLATTRELLMKYRVIYWPVSHEMSKEGTVTSLKVDYIFYHIPSGTQINASAVGQGADKFDKGAGKASTYADKYMIMRMLHMVTGDDPDYTGNEEHQKSDEELQVKYQECKNRLEDLKLDGKVTEDYYNSAKKALDTYLAQKDHKGIETAVSTLGVGK